jgi:hypothetical protein
MLQCDICEAVGETCCAAAKARRETAIILAGIVERQTTLIQGLTAERDAARAALRELMELHRVGQ